MRDKRTPKDVCGEASLLSDMKNCTDLTQFLNSKIDVKCENKSPVYTGITNKDLLVWTEKLGTSLSSLNTSICSMCRP